MGARGSAGAARGAQTAGAQGGRCARCRARGRGTAGRAEGTTGLGVAWACLVRRLGQLGQVKVLCTLTQVLDPV